MGITIETAKTDGFPRQIRLTLKCDKTTSLLCHGTEVFEGREGFVGGHKQAMMRGWLERQSNHGRIWLCPACSGKLRQDEGDSTSGG